MDKYSVVRISVDFDDYLIITTVRGGMTSIEQAKRELRVIARTDMQKWAEGGEDDFDDYFNEDLTSWGYLPGDRSKTRFVIVKDSFGLKVRVIS